MFWWHCREGTRCCRERECGVKYSLNRDLSTALENHVIVAYVPVAEIGSLKLPNGNPHEAKVLTWFKAYSILVHLRAGRVQENNKETVDGEYAISNCVADNL